jgi:hypothetical protein
LRACLAEPPVVVGEFSHGRELFGRGGEVSRSALATIGQHGAGVKFAAGAAAGGFSAAAAEGVEGAGQERFASEEGLQQSRELLLQVAELQTEGTEVVWHGSALREKAGISVDYYKYISTEFKAPLGNNLAEAKIVEFAPCAAKTPVPLILRGREWPQRPPSGRLGLSSSSRPRTPPTPFYAAAAELPLTSESQSLSCT